MTDIRKLMEALAQIEEQPVVEAPGTQKWAVVFFNRYDAFRSTVKFVRAKNVSEALVAATPGMDSSDVDNWMQEYGRQGKQVWGMDDEEESVLVFPVK